MILLDVREDWEVKLAPVPTPALHIPMVEIPIASAELAPKKEVVVICRSGGRSAQVASTSSAKVLKKFLTSPAEFWPGPGL